MNVVRSALTLLVTAVALAVPRTTLAQAPRPNIIYIITDDQGWKDVGFHGSYIKTPKIDALATGGARLEQY